MPSVLHWLRSTAASPSDHAAHSQARPSKRTARTNKPRQQASQQHQETANPSMQHTHAQQNSVPNPIQHTSQLSTSDGQSKNAASHVTAAHLLQPDLCAVLADREAAAAATPSAVAASAGAAAAGEACGISGAAATLGWSMQRDWASMDCLSQLRDAMFADLPLPVAAEPLLDHAAGELRVLLLEA